MEAHTHTVLLLCCLDDRLISQGRHEGVKVWQQDKATLQLLHYVAFQHAGFCRCTVSQDGVLAHPTSTDSEIVVRDMESHMIVRLFPDVHRVKLGAVMQMRLIKALAQLTESTMLAVYESGHLLLWDWPNSICLSQVQLPEMLMCVTYNEVVNRVVVAGAGHQFSVFTITEDRQLQVIATTKMASPGVSCVVERHDSRILAVGCWDGKLRLYSLKTLKPLAVLTYHNMNIECAVFSEKRVETWDCEKLLAVGSKDHKISLWKVYDNL